ncbi:MAG: nucleotidyl transferase AbiEii/AbiGii toxin family protein, partial [Candidatus Omnitrophica bacterium]|nr:nucleotidyl transferase AbiEii/AbiGii toxin family protein [Candidatus Omnitrophota bacterium]
MLDISQIESFYPDYLRPFKKNILREYVQYKILNLIFQSKFGNSLVFMGGTAIHILYGNTRFSEDLDFDSFGLKQSQFK